MGAPTGCRDVWMVMLPRDSVAPVLLTPVIVTIAAESVESRFMASQVLESGVQVRDAACCGVSVGGLLVGEVQRGSMSPARRGSPGAGARIALAWVAKVVFH